MPRKSPPVALGLRTQPWSSGGGRVAHRVRWVRCPAPAGMGVRSQAGPWCQAGTPRHPLHGGGGRRKDAGPAGRCAPPERLDDAGEPGQLAFFYPLFGVSVQYLKVCSGVGASYWLIQVCHFSPLGFIKVCHQVGGTWRSFYWDNERRRG